MSYESYSMNDMAVKLAEQITTKTEQAILEQLNEFISRGLIVLETTQPMLVRTSMSIEDSMEPKIEYKYTVKLKLKDQEYIEKLESENRVLKGRLEDINKALVDTSVCGR